jgi:hypothetical protein
MTMITATTIPMTTGMTIRTTPMIMITTMATLIPVTPPKATITDP